MMSIPVLSAVRPTRTALVAMQAGGALAAGLTLTFIHWYASRLPITQASPVAILDALFSLCFVSALLLLAWAFGARLLTRLALAWHSPLEAACFQTTIGLAAISYLIFVLGVVGLLYSPLTAAILFATAVVLRDDVRICTTSVVRAVRAIRQGGLAHRPLALIVTVAGGALLVIGLAIALLPPFSYDALWYHLAAPQDFLRQHRLTALPALPQANMPLAMEMLYAVCLMFGVQNGPALLHLACAILVILATWSFAARWFDQRVAWFSIAALATASDLIHWAVLPNIDLGLTLFVFLALYGLIAWRMERSRSWLILAAVVCGMALATKYTALIDLLILLVLLAGNPRSAWPSLRAVGRQAALFTAIALAVAAPWYVKNALLLHDPVSPFLAAPYVNPLLLTSPTVAPIAATLPSRWLTALTVPLHLIQSENDMALAGRSWQDYLALPFRLYSRGDLETYGRPSFLFLLAPFALLARRRSPPAGALALFGLLGFGAWAVGGQELRYLLPVFPAFALLAGCTLAMLAGRWTLPGIRKRVTALVVAAALVVALVESLIVAAIYNPLPVLGGRESRDAFLRREVNVYGADAYLQSVLAPGDRVLALGDGRSYYSRLPMILDSTYDMEHRVFTVPGSTDRSAALLQLAGIDYVLVDRRDLDWRQQFNSAAQEDNAAFERFRADHLVMIYDAMDVQVYHVVPPGGPP
jgi:hypothetical protein